MVRSRLGIVVPLICGELDRMAEKHTLFPELARASMLVGRGHNAIAISHALAISTLERSAIFQFNQIGTDASHDANRNGLSGRYPTHGKYGDSIANSIKMHFPFILSKIPGLAPSTIAKKSPRAPTLGWQCVKNWHAAGMGQLIEIVSVKRIGSWLIAVEAVIRALVDSSRLNATGCEQHNCQQYDANNEV